MTALQSPVIVWFRDDLRLSDNPALSEAAKTGRPIVPVYILEDAPTALRRLGGAARWWLHHSLGALSTSLSALGLSLVLKRGDAKGVLEDLIGESGAKAVYWNRRYDGSQIEVDTAIKSALVDEGIEVRSFKANLLAEPWEIQTKSGGSFRVFTPFWRTLRDWVTPNAPAERPSAAAAAGASLKSEPLNDLDLLPSRGWADGFSDHWQPGESGALARLDTFLDQSLGIYDDGRDRPFLAATSRLSPHLRFGEISPRQIWMRTLERCDQSGLAPDKFLSEIAWREFSYHLLFVNPDLARTNYSKKFDAFPWMDDDQDVQAWTEGMTGYPIVDAGMRELWATGWMHNRVRMIAASFLIKHLMTDWRHGETWFWDTLVDADPANNPASWQWVAGSGADAAPYFRIFNPILQGEKFDPEGRYVKTWVPELRDLEAKWIHKPWQAPSSHLDKAGVTIPGTYPAPIVDHAMARNRALDAFKSLRD